MAGAIGAGTITTTFSSAGAYNDFSDQIVKNVVGDGQDLPDAPDVTNRYPSNITVSIETIVMSALIFIAILSWFEFLRSWYDNVFNIDGTRNYTAIYHRLWYAIFITALVIILLYIVYRIASIP